MAASIASINALLTKFGVGTAAPNPLILIAKGAGALVFAGISLWVSGETELFVQVGTVVLALAAAATLCFAATRRVRVSAALVLVSVPVCQHAVDFYYWFGVQRHGLPWPWVAAEQGGASSVALQAGQVADFSFCLLVVIAALVAACHLTIRSSGPPTAAAELKR